MTKFYPPKNPCRAFGPFRKIDYDYDYDNDSDNEKRIGT